MPSPPRPRPAGPPRPPADALTPAARRVVPGGGSPPSDASLLVLSIYDDQFDEGPRWRRRLAHTPGPGSMVSSDAAMRRKTISVSAMGIATVLHSPALAPYRGVSGPYRSPLRVHFQVGAQVEALGDLCGISPASPLIGPYRVVQRPDTLRSVPMPGGALACVLPPERSTPGPPSRPDIAYAGLRRDQGSHKGRGTRQNATRRWASPLRATQLNIGWTGRSWQGEGHADRCGVSADRAGR
jgi:hypothetical protein